MSLNKNWVFTFGKHKGKTLEFVYSTDMGYVAFCLRNIKWFFDLVIKSEDEWIKKMRKNIARAERQYQNDLNAWAWGVTTYPIFGQGVKILYDGRQDGVEIDL